MQKKQITSLQALRAIAFIGIFLVHAGSPIYWSGLGVSVFFVMSGFLLMYKHGDVLNDTVSLKYSIKDSIKKISKLYPLHIITMLCVVLLQLARMFSKGVTLKGVGVLFAKIGLNVTLLQSWIPDRSYNTSLNGVAWYISVTLFLYIIFPYIAKAIKDKQVLHLIIICLITLILQVVLCIPAVMNFDTKGNLYTWFMYCFPLFRVGDFLIGCCIGKLYLKYSCSFDISIIKGTIFEVGTTIFTILIFLWLKYDKSDLVIIESIQNWTTPYIPIAALWVFLFALNKGLITKLFSNKVFIYIGNISSVNFLVHYVVIMYINTVLNMFGNLSLGMKIIVGFAEFIISILVSAIYIKLNEYITKKIKEKNKSIKPFQI